jgi:hypothetical protein
MRKQTFNEEELKGIERVYEQYFLDESNLEVY